MRIAILFDISTSTYFEHTFGIFIRDGAVLTIDIDNQKRPKIHLAIK